MIISVDISVLLKIYGYEYEYVKFSWILSMGSPSLRLSKFGDEAINDLRLLHDLYFRLPENFDVAGITPARVTNAPTSRRRRRRSGKSLHKAWWPRAVRRRGKTPRVPGLGVGLRRPGRPGKPRRPGRPRRPKRPR